MYKSNNHIEKDGQEDTADKKSFIKLGLLAG